MILQTERLDLRPLVNEDFAELCEILQDEQTMYAYEGAFSDEEARRWLERQLNRYRQDGIGLWAVILRETGELIGQAGLTWQDVEYEGGLIQQKLEIGYLFKRKHWHHGYATEAALGCQKYAFETMDAAEVCSIIRDTNTASQRVAERGGMQPVHTFVKHYRGIMMPHLVYRITREEYLRRKASGTD